MNAQRAAGSTAGIGKATRSLEGRLSAALPQGEVAAVVAAEVGGPFAQPCVVLRRGEENWAVAAALGCDVQIDSTPAAPLDQWLAKVTGRRWWVPHRVVYQDRILAEILTTASVPGAHVRWVAAVAARYFVGKRPANHISSHSFEGDIARVVHDAKQPLTSIALSLEQIALGHEIEKNVERCKKAIRAERELLDALLSVATANGAAHVPIDVSTVVRDVVQLLGAQATAAHVEVRAQCEPRAAVSGDAKALRRAFANLLDNAISVTGPGGAVEVTSCVDHGRVILEIADQGPGVPEQLRDRVFEPFFTTRRSGSGIGLAVVRAVVQAHRGDVGIVDSTRGARFRVELPQLGT